jgi:hypothetical protein
MTIEKLFAAILMASTIAAQAFQAQSSSTITSNVKDGERTVEILNTTYDVTAEGIPGRPPNEHLVLKKTVHIKSVIGEIGEEASVRIEAWPLSADLKQKPLYSISVEGTDARVEDTSLIVISRGTEEVDWWSVYQLGSGRHLFDTSVPLVPFSSRRDLLTMRYAGIEVPEDDAKDARLRDPHVVGVLIYASAEKVIQEALVTCDDPKRAVILRSFADATRTMRWNDRSLSLSISQNYPSPPATVSITVPVAGDALDFPKVQAPAGIHVSAWKR